MSAPSLAGLRVQTARVSYRCHRFLWAERLAAVDAEYLGEVSP